MSADEADPMIEVERAPFGVVVGGDLRVKILMGNARR